MITFFCYILNMKEMTNVTDTEGQPIPYGVLLDFTWWGGIDGTDEYHCKCKILKRKRGDIYEITNYCTCWKTKRG